MVTDKIIHQETPTHNSNMEINTIENKAPIVVSCVCRCLVCSWCLFSERERERERVREKDRDSSAKYAEHHTESRNLFIHSGSGCARVAHAFVLHWNPKTSQQTNTLHIMLHYKLQYNAHTKCFVLNICTLVRSTHTAALGIVLTSPTKHACVHLTKSMAQTMWGRVPCVSVLCA